MPFLLNTIANQQADLLMSDALQLEEAFRSSLMKNGEADLPDPMETIPQQESRDVYEFPGLKILTDRLAALHQKQDSLIAQKFHVQALIDDYSFYVAEAAHRAEQNDEISDDWKERLEQSFARNFQNAQNDRNLRTLEELQREIEDTEQEITAQENAIKEYQAIAGEDEQEDTTMTEAECLVCLGHDAQTIHTQCQHKICKTCMHAYVFKTRNMNLPTSCPADCQGQIGLEQLEDHLTADDVDKLYRHNELKKLIESGAAFYCARPSCSEVLEVAEDTDIRVLCPSCQLRMCSSCKVPWHNNFTCEQYQNLPEAHRSQSDLTLLNLARAEQWKQCPRCRAMISLDTGCYHMTCRCKYQFCYLCSTEWDKQKANCPAGCPLFDDNNTPDEPIVEPQFVRAVQAYIPERRVGLLRNPPRGINLVDVNVERTTPAMRRSILELECMYCDRNFGSLAALNNHINFTQQHPVFACCGKLFINQETLYQHTQNARQCPAGPAFGFGIA